MHKCVFIELRSQIKRIDRAKCHGPPPRVCRAAMADCHGLGAWRLEAGIKASEGLHFSEAALLGCPSLYRCLSGHNQLGVSTLSSVRLDQVPLTATF